MAATDCSSSCGPQPNSHPPPPIAQAPNPTRVICMPVWPSWAFFNCVLCISGLLSHLPDRLGSPLRYEPLSQILNETTSFETMRSGGPRTGVDPVRRRHLRTRGGVPAQFGGFDAGEEAAAGEQGVGGGRGGQRLGEVGRRLAGGGP